MAIIPLKWGATCGECGKELAAGSPARYHGRGQIDCLDCPDPYADPCPRCGSTAIMEVIYGLPGEKAMWLQSIGEAELRGCIVDSPVNRKCKKCEHEWEEGD